MFKEKGKEIMNKKIEQLLLNGYITVAELFNDFSFIEKTVGYYMNKLHDNRVIERKVRQNWVNGFLLILKNK